MDSVRTAAEFESHRNHLTGVAYRMLGTMADAEDAVQETYVRFARVDTGALRDVRGWLTTTTVARICLDELGSARQARALRVRGYPSRSSAPEFFRRYRWAPRTGSPWTSR